MVKFVDKYTADIADKDYFVFLKTPWKELRYDENAKRKLWKRTEDNFVYALRPNRMVRGSRVAAEAYAMFAGKLQKIYNAVLDSITQDCPLNLADACETDDPDVVAEKEEDFAEYDVLVSALAKEKVFGSDSVIVEDAESWQKDNATKKWGRELKKIHAAMIEGTEEALSRVA